MSCAANTLQDLGFQQMCNPLLGLPAMEIYEKPEKVNHFALKSVDIAPWFLKIDKFSKEIFKHKI